MKDYYIPETHFPVKLQENVYMLGNYFFNLFLIKGENRSALFETGISATVDAVIRQINSLSILPDYIICSHPHSDHLTGLGGLRDAFPKARVIAAGGAADFIRHPKAIEMAFLEDVHMSKSLADLGLTPGRPPITRMPDLEDALFVDRLHTLDLGGMSLELHRVEGHSPGNLIAFIPEHKILFSSDSLGFHFPGRCFLPLFFTKARFYLATLDKIKALAPFIVCPAHQGPIAGEKASSAILESINTTTGLIKKINRSSLTDEAMADKIFKKYYKDEFTIYSQTNISNCARLLVKRARQFEKKH